MKRSDLKFEFDAPNGCRVFKGFLWVQTKDYWWSHDDQEWMKIEDIDGACSNSYSGVNSFKAFQRHLLKHPHIIGQATLCNRFHQRDDEGNHLYDFNIHSVE